MSRTPYGFQKLLWHMTRIGMVPPSTRKTCATSGYWDKGGYRWGEPGNGRLKDGDIVGQEMWYIRDGERIYSHGEQYEVVEVMNDRNGRVKWKRIR